MKRLLRISDVMKIADDSLRLENLFELDNVYWGGKKNVASEAAEHRAKLHFLPQSFITTGHPVHMRMSKVKAFSSFEIGRWSLRHLDVNCIVVTDGYRPFSKICHVVDLHHSINADGIYKDQDNKFFHWLYTMIGNVKRSIHGTYHSVSSKHLPRYLAEFNFRFNNRFNMGSMIDDFIRQAVKTTPQSDYKLKLAEEWG